jgi:hypothetical protein
MLLGCSTYAESRDCGGHVVSHPLCYGPNGAFQLKETQCPCSFRDRLRIPRRRDAFGIFQRASRE